MRYLITGGCGFIGSNLSTEVIKRGEELFVLDNLSRYGSDENLKWLKSLGDLQHYSNDIRNINLVENIIRDIKPDIIFHLAGQVAMTTSLKDPRLDFETNVIGTINLLEAVRLYSPKSIILFSSTNKVYGDLNYLHYEEESSRYSCLEYPHGFDENLKLDFHSPYGCSKGAADQYMLDYHRMFGLRTVVFRHSSMYGGNQHATYDQGWVGWFIQKALEIKKGTVTEPFTISGNGKQVRDILYSSDVVDLYFAASEYIEKAQGRVFNIGGGIENSLSLLELFSLLEERLSIKITYERKSFRSSDQLVFVSDNSKAERIIGWYPKISFTKGVSSILDSFSF